MLAVCITLFVTKAVIAYRDLDNPTVPPWIATGSWHASIGRISMCCAADFAVGFGCLFLAAVALRLWSSPRFHLAARLLAPPAAVVAIAYMVLNAQIYHVVRHFLTVSLFHLSGGFKPERSILEYATPSFRLALALLPLTALTIHLAVVRAWPRFWQHAANYLCRPVVLLLLIFSLFRASQAAQERYFPVTSSDFAHNPHLLLACSLLPDKTFDEGDAGPPGDLSDFLPGQPGHTPGLLEDRPTNIIVIVLECGASNYMQSHGYPLPTTPRLCKLQDRSLIFDNFYATANHTIASALPIFGSTYNDPQTLAAVIQHPGSPCRPLRAGCKNRVTRPAFSGPAVNERGKATATWGPLSQRKDGT